MKVASIVLNNFVHDNRVLKEGISLICSGHEVHVVAIHEKELQREEVVNGLHVTRVNLKSKGLPGFFIFQAMKYLEFMFRVISRFHRFDVFHCHDLNALPIGALVKVFFNRKAKIIYDAHEYEIEKNGLSNFGKGVARLLERHLIGFTDKVITVSEGIANEYSRLYGVKPYLILNCPEPQEVGQTNYLREHFGIADSARIFIYQGGLISGRAVKETIEAFSEMSDDKVIVFVGYGYLAEYVQSAAGKNANIFYHDAVSYEDLLQITASADVGLSLIDNICKSYLLSLPNKFFEYIAASIPVLASNLPEMAKIVDQHNIGMLSEGNNVKEIVRSVSAISKTDLTVYKEGLAAAGKIYTWQNQEVELRKLYESLND